MGMLLNGVRLAEGPIKDKVSGTCKSICATDISFFSILEAKHKAEAHTIAVDAWLVDVGETTNIVNTKEFEDIVHTSYNLNIGCLLIHHTRLGRELHQQWVVGILSQHGVILISKGAPHSLHGNILAPLEMFQ